MIQVSSTVHAAVTLYAVEPGADAKGVQFLQSPAGCILQRTPVEDGAANGWIVLLDYGLDSGSTALTCTPFVSEDPRTTPPSPIMPLLFHIDDRVKVLITVAMNDGEWHIVNQSFHALFMNFQANQQELYPVDLGSLPPSPS